MSLNFALAQQKNPQALQSGKIKEKDRTVDMGVIFHINDILNDSL